VPSPPTPKDRFSCVDALALVRELRTLGAARVEKAFDAPDGGWILLLHPPGEAKRELLLVPGRFAALRPPDRDRGEELSPVARELRRLLSGAFVRAVAEPGAERYLEIELSRSDAPEGLRLAVEFFGTGNLIVARGASIALVTRPRAWAHRTLRIGSEYARPPTRADPWSMGVPEIEAELRRSRSDLARTLAARFSLGGPVAEELVARGEFSGSDAAGDPGGVAAHLHRLLAELKAELGDRPRGFLYRREGLPVDATPYPSRRWEGWGTEEIVPSFSEAALAYFPGAVVPEPTESEQRLAQERAELERQIDRQRTAVAELTEAISDRRRAADAALAHYPAAEAALAEARAASPARETVVLEVEGGAVTLPVARDPRRSAQMLYDEAKRLGVKLAGARTALEESERRRSHPTAPVEPPRPAVRTARRSAFWFERYRWFVTSDGAVAIAGRDAATNDLIVRRNLKDGDHYVHADLHGAASVVLKRRPDGEPPSEESLREACQWAAAFSKAWRAGYATGTAFWATPEQVSKAAASGEFVARGAWVIHGTKHFVRDVPLELALGTIRYEGAERWTVAPPSSVRARGTVRFLITPGEERDRARWEVELSTELGVDRTLLQSLLPAGGIAVRRP